MRKFFIICLLLLFAPFVFSKEIFVSKPGSQDGISCQAVRIKDNWFLTAGHCIADICSTSSCEIEMQVSDGIIKTPRKNVYWLYEKHGKSSYDIALINFENAKINDSFKEPQIIIFDNSLKFTEPKMIKRNLKIPFNFGGNAGNILSRNEIFYGPKSKIIFTRDLGLFHGLSGAGVFTDKGELIAITSATASKENEGRFSVFAVFDDRVEGFLSKIPALSFKHITSSDFKNVNNEDKEILISLDND